MSILSNFFTLLELGLLIAILVMAVEVYKKLNHDVNHNYELNHLSRLRSTDIHPITSTTQKNSTSTHLSGLKLDKKYTIIKGFSQGDSGKISLFDPTTGIITISDSSQHYFSLSLDIIGPDGPAKFTVKLSVIKTTDSFNRDTGYTATPAGKWKGVSLEHIGSPLAPYKGTGGDNEYYATLVNDYGATLRPTYNMYMNLPNGTYYIVVEKVESEQDIFIPVIFVD